MKFGEIEIGQDYPPLFIGEISGNHNGSLERALDIVDAMAEAGVRAIKLQTYTADTMTIPSDRKGFVVTEVDSPWLGSTLYDLYSEAYTPWDWHPAIFERAHGHGMLAFSTPFDITAVDFLEQLEVPLYKISSFESTDHALVRRVANTGKPMIISTGLSNLRDIAETVDVARSEGCRDIVLLKCTSSYPASPRDSNLVTLPHLRSAFGVEVGISDHTRGIGAAIASVALGASVIEKHVTLSRADGGVDSGFSLEPDEVRALVSESERAHSALGSVAYTIGPEERKSLRFRRSIYVVEDVPAGALLTSQNVRVIRPGFGLAPKEIERVIGRRASEDLVRGTALTWDMIE